MQFAEFVETVQVDVITVSDLVMDAADFCKNLPF